MALNVLVNQVGYERNGPKRFVARSDENLGPSARFEVTDATGRTLFEGGAERVDRAAAGPCHYVGRFGAFRHTGGDFQIRFEAGNEVATSYRFGVGTSILWRLTKPLVLQFIHEARATRTNYRGPGPWKAPGILDEDGRFYDVGGGWFDRGLMGSSSLPQATRALGALTLAHGRDGRDPQVQAEMRWGGEWLKRLLIQYPSSGRIAAGVDAEGRLRLLGPGGLDSGPEPEMGLLAGFLCAKLSEALADTGLLRRGERFWEEYNAGHSAAGPGPAAGPPTDQQAAAMLMSDIALHVATLEPRYLAAAERRVERLLGKADEAHAMPDGSQAGGRFRRWETPGVSLPAAALAEFAASVPEHPHTPRAKEAVGAFLDARVEAARADPFGLTPPAAGVAPGEVAMRRAEEAWLALAARRVTSRNEYVELATDALNWLLGLNPSNTCLLEGAGSRTGGRGASGKAPAPQGALVSPEAPADIPGIGAVGAYLAAVALV